nr:fimbrial protein [Enterobacter sp. ENT02]
METPCKIDINSQNISVNFGKFNMPRDNVPGIIASKAFSMKLISCPVTQSKVNATISGIADAINPTKSFKNTGTAKNVAIELLSENKDAGPGQVLSGTIVNQEYTFNFIANAVSRGDISPGTINATATVTFTYP